MTSHRLGGAYGWNLVGKSAFDGDRFEFVADVRGGAVSIDIAYVGRLNLGIANGVLHHSESAFVLGSGRSNVVCVATHAIPDDFGEDFGTAITRVLEIFHDQYASTFAHH